MGSAGTLAKVVVQGKIEIPLRLTSSLSLLQTLFG